VLGGFEHLRVTPHAVPARRLADTGVGTLVAARRGFEHVPRQVHHFLEPACAVRLEQPIVQMFERSRRVRDEPARPARVADRIDDIAHRPLERLGQMHQIVHLRIGALGQQFRGIAVQRAGEFRPAPAPGRSGEVQKCLQLLSSED